MKQVYKARWTDLSEFQNIFKSEIEVYVLYKSKQISPEYSYEKTNVEKMRHDNSTVRAYANISNAFLELQWTFIHM